MLLRYSLARSGPSRIFAILDRRDESESVRKRVHPKASHHAQSVILRVTTPVSLLSFALAMILTMNARRHQRTHPLSGMGSPLKASKDIGMGVNDHPLTCGSEPCVLQWSAQLALVAYFLHTIVIL